MLDPAFLRRAEAMRLYANANIPIGEIARRLDVAPRTIRRWAVEERWPPRPAQGRLYGAVARKPAASPTATECEDEASVDADSGGATPAASSRPQRPADRTRKRSPTPTTRKRLINRLYHLIDHTVTTMETRMSDDTPSNGQEPERDMRVIGNVVRSVEKLKELEPEQANRDAAGGGTGRAFLSAEEEDLIRRRVIDHLIKLRERQRREEGLS